MEVDLRGPGFARGSTEELNRLCQGDDHGYKLELYFSVFVIRSTEYNWAEEEVLEGGKTLLTF